MQGHDGTQGNYVKARRMASVSDSKRLAGTSSAVNDYLIEIRRQ